MKALKYNMEILLHMEKPCLELQVRTGWIHWSQARTYATKGKQRVLGIPKLRNARYSFFLDIWEIYILKEKRHYGLVNCYSRQI